MNGIEKLHPQNHTLYLQVQRMLNLRMKYDDICDVVGLVGSSRVNELCEWFIAYKTPKPLPMVTVSDPITWHGKPVHNPRQMTEQFMAWRKQHEGARKALEAANL